MTHVHLTAWLFPGQGSQFVGMGRDLTSAFAPAREILAAASAIAGVDLAAIIERGPEPLLTRTDHLQPALTAINIGCCRLLEAEGFRPDAVAGHSLGEFAALYAARVLTLEDTLRLVVERGRLMHAAASTLTGGMLAVKDLDAAVVEGVVAQLSTHNGVGIANYNSPRQIAISGELESLTLAATMLTARGGRVVRLNVSGPWHSPLLADASERFVEVLRAVAFHPARVPVVLNVSGAAATDAVAIRSAMERQLCATVRLL